MMVSKTIDVVSITAGRANGLKHVTGDKMIIRTQET